MNGRKEAYVLIRTSCCCRDHAETIRVLRIDANDLEGLVGKELPAIHIAGSRRFAVRDVEALVVPLRQSTNRR
jgi:hypothetical protein